MASRRSRLLAGAGSGLVVRHGRPEDTWRGAPRRPVLPAASEDLALAPGEPAARAALERALVLGEKVGRERLLGAVVVAAGTVLVALG